MGYTFFPEWPTGFGIVILFPQRDIEVTSRRFILEQVVYFLGSFKSIPGGDDKGNPSPVG